MGIVPSPFFLVLMRALANRCHDRTTALFHRSYFLLLLFFFPPRLSLHARESHPWKTAPCSLLSDTTFSVCDLFLSLRIIMNFDWYVIVRFFCAIVIISVYKKKRRVTILTTFSTRFVHLSVRSWKNSIFHRLVCPEIAFLPIPPLDEWWDSFENLNGTTFPPPLLFSSLRNPLSLASRS